MRVSIQSYSHIFTSRSSAFCSHLILRFRLCHFSLKNMEAQAEREKALVEAEETKKKAEARYITQNFYFLTKTLWLAIPDLIGRNVGVERHVLVDTRPTITHSRLLHCFYLPVLISYISYIVIQLYNIHVWWVTLNAEGRETTWRITQRLVFHVLVCLFGKLKQLTRTIKTLKDSEQIDLSDQHVLLISRVHDCLDILHIVILRLQTCCTSKVHNVELFLRLPDAKGQSQTTMSYCVTGLHTLGISRKRKKRRSRRPTQPKRQQKTRPAPKLPWEPLAASCHCFHTSVTVGDGVNQRSCCSCTSFSRHAFRIARLQNTAKMHRKQEKKQRLRTRRRRTP